MNIGAHQDSLTSRVSTGMVWNLVGKTFSTGLAFALMVMVARWLPPVEFGTYSLIMAIFNALLMATSLGLDTGLLKYLPEFKARSETAFAREIIGGALAGKFALLAVAAVGLIMASNFILSRLFAEIHMQKACLYVIPLILIPCGLNVLFRSALDADYEQRMLNIVDVLAVTSRLVFTACLLRGGYAVLGVLVANVIIEWGMLLFFLVVFRSKIQMPHSSGARQIKKLFTFSLTMWITSFAAFLMGKSSDLLLLGTFSDSHTVGLYNLAYTFSSQVYLFMTLPLGNLALVAASELYGGRDELRLAKMSGLFLKYHLLFVPPMCVGGVLLAEPILRSLYGESYLGATPLLQLYMVVFAINILFSGTFSTLLTSIEQHKMLMVSTLTLGISNLLLNLFLVPRYGALGALAGTGLIQIANACWLGIVLRRKVPWEFPATFACKACFAAVVMAVGLTALSPRAASLGGLLLVIALGGLLYALVLKASRPFSELELNILRDSRMPGNKLFLRLLKPV